MRMGQAIGAAHHWRSIVALHLNLGREPISDMWLEAGHAGGYDFVPLGSTAVLADEARAMKNCLLTYGSNLAHNRSRLWSVRRDGARVATLKVARRFRDPLPMIVELRGPGNADVPRELWWAARRWLHMNDLLQVEMAEREWGAPPLDRATWLALWRPYWLARRRIPQWLPIAPSRAAFDAL
jgi:hypothetical protein